MRIKSLLLLLCTVNLIGGIGVMSCQKAGLTQDPEHLDHSASPSKERSEITSRVAALADIELSDNIISITTYGIDSADVVIGESIKSSYAYRYNHNNKVFAEIESKDNMFIVRSTNENAFWQVKKDKDVMDIVYSVYGGLRIQIKPSKKDESVISFLYPDKNTDLGEISIDPTTNKVVVLDENGNVRFNINTTKFSGGYGLLLVPQFYDSLKYITIAEIARRGW